MKRENQEHILVCLSASPSNAHIIETAAKMTKAFDAQFSALYVSSPDAAAMSAEDKDRLQRNISFAEKSGATVTTVYGDDVSFQIGEFARLSRVTKVVLGRSTTKRRMFDGKPLTDRLTAIAPDIEIHIIPDHAAETKYPRSFKSKIYRLLPDWKNILITLAILAVATGIGALFSYLKISEASIVTVYVLSVLLTAIFTQNYICGVLCSIASVLIYNVLFVEPRFSLRVNEVGTYVTFVVMLIASLVTSALANRLQYTAKQSIRAAYRTRVLFDTDRLLQQQTDSDELLATMARQLVQLMDREVAVYSAGELSAQVFRARNDEDNVFDSENAKRIFDGETDEIETDDALYRAVAIFDRVYGVVGVRVDNKPLESLEKSIFRSIVGECALAIDNVHSREEKERAALNAKQEQLRGNILRAISHDLRTPLTAIAGNADCLLNTDDKLDNDTRKQLFEDIYNDAMWLYSLVENLLSVTRLDSHVELNFTCELADELIDEAIRHIHRRSNEYDIMRNTPDTPLLVKVDTKLILQVFVNLIDNAIKYTPKGSKIVISAEKVDNGVRFSVADNGDGIADPVKEKVFEMFYTGDNTVVDSRRSLGLGLALCKSIVAAHGGNLTVSDNVPHGAVFSFILPQGEVNISE